VLQPQIRTILVAVADPSSARQPAVDRAARLAAPLGARMVLFHAAFEPALSGRPFFDSKRLAKSRGWFVADRTRQLERHAAKLRSSGLDVDACAVWEDPVHEAVVRAALREKADLVVAGRHERRADRPPQLRLTDWELMRLCPRPLLLTRSVSNSSESGSVLAALDPTHAYDKPAHLDISIAGYAAALAQALQVELHAVHCLPNAAYPPGEVTSAQRQRMRKRVQAQLQRVMKKSGLTAGGLHVLNGSVTDSLPALARELPAQIIAMGIISRRWLKRFVIGDTAESIIREAPCDLLLIKPDNFRIRLGRSRKQAIVLPKAR
jgi:universal stress protein E